MLSVVGCEEILNIVVGVGECEVAGKEGAFQGWLRLGQAYSKRSVLR
jgi:hypothetical protein